MNILQTLQLHCSYLILFNTMIHKIGVSLIRPTAIAFYHELAYGKYMYVKGHAINRFGQSPCVGICFQNVL